ncbi:hypothetical protein JF259_01795 [Snuella sp. CAU 1569]|uniref:Tetratricopeptide repeat protein n=1 Tax=Snuella sedimenti TaxID=2798802 RepID=A0A8J7LR49_9FLAO|nr:hypothetical protein [Snuella sedimenti]
MKNLLLIILILTFVNCKNDSDRVISKNSNDAEIIYRNHFKRGWMKDSIASATFDLASEQNAKGNYKKAKELYQKANQIVGSPILELSNFLKFQQSYCF